MNYKKELNKGNIATVIAALVSIISCFLPFASDRYHSYSYKDISDFIDRDAFTVFFYIALVGAIIVAVVSICKVNWLSIVCSTIMLFSNGLVIAACFAGATSARATRSLGVGYYFFTIATLGMFVCSIVGAVMNSKAKTAYAMGTGANRSQQYGQVAPQYGRQPQYGQVAPQYGQQPQYGQAAPQYGQQPQYGQAAAQYGQQPQYQAAPQQPAYQKAAQTPVSEPAQPVQQEAVPQPEAAPEQSAADSAFVTPSFEAPQYDAQEYEAPEDEEITLVLDQITGNNSQL